MYYEGGKDLLRTMGFGQKLITGPDLKTKQIDLGKTKKWSNATWDMAEDRPSLLRDSAIILPGVNETRDGHAGPHHSPDTFHHPSRIQQRTPKQSLSLQSEIDHHYT